MAKYWVQKGASKDKLVIGVSSYGRSFTLTSPSQNGVGAPAGRAGAAGTYTRENGFLAFYEVRIKPIARGQDFNWRILGRVN